MLNTDRQNEALSNAVNGQSLTNYSAIFQGFMAKGIPEADIKPRENVFTFNAWKALGRVVCKGEHGVKVVTFAPVTRRNDETGENETVGKRPWTTTVFHISQTKPIGEADKPKAEAAPIQPIKSTPKPSIENQDRWVVS